MKNEKEKTFKSLCGGKRYDHADHHTLIQNCVTQVVFWWLYKAEKCSANTQRRRVIQLESLMCRE